jgi:hypothetical protein
MVTHAKVTVTGLRDGHIRALQPRPAETTAGAA